MSETLHTLATRLQAQLLEKAAALPAETWARQVPRVLLDSWASLVRWHEAGEQVARISASMADETGDMVLASGLRLASARVRAEAVCYILPEESEWIVLARHAPAPCEVVVKDAVRWAYRQPVLTYCTMIGDTLAAGFYSLEDYPTSGDLPLLMARRGSVIGRKGERVLGEAETMEEEARVSLALIHHYLGR